MSSQPHSISFDRLVPDTKAGEPHAICLRNISSDSSIDLLSTRTSAGCCTTTIDDNNAGDRHDDINNHDSA
jgi:hypothetical protein